MCSYNQNKFQVTGSNVQGMQFSILSFTKHNFWVGFPSQHVIEKQLKSLKASGGQEASCLGCHCLPKWHLLRCPSPFFDAWWLGHAHHPRLPCLSLSPGVCSNSCPQSQLCYLTVSSSAAPFSFCLQPFPTLSSFSVSQLHIRWPKYWNLSLSNSPSNE